MRDNLVLRLLQEQNQESKQLEAQRQPRNSLEIHDVFDGLLENAWKILKSYSSDDVLITQKQPTKWIGLSACPVSKQRNCPVQMSLREEASKGDHKAAMDVAWCKPDAKP